MLLGWIKFKLIFIYILCGRVHGKHECHQSMGIFWGHYLKFLTCISFFFFVFFLNLRFYLAVPGVPRTFPFLLNSLCSWDASYPTGRFINPCYLTIWLKSDESKNCLKSNSLMRSSYYSLRTSPLLFLCSSNALFWSVNMIKTNHI